MSSLFQGVQYPVYEVSSTTTTTASTTTDAAKAKEEERLRLARRKGLAANVLTNYRASSGSTASNSAAKTLLGE